MPILSSTSRNTTPSRIWWSVPYLYFLGLITIILPVIYLSQAAWTTILPYIYLVVSITLLDGVFGRETRNSQDLEHDKFFDYVAWGLIPLHYIFYFAAIFIITTVEFPFWAVLLMALGIGFYNGNLITIGHELGHRHDKLNQFWAKIALALPTYGHFTLEHNRGHHVRVATPEDPASARLGENVYRFAMRDMIGNIKGGWAFEKARLAKKDLPVWHYKNSILQVNLAGLAITLGLIAICGWHVLPFIILHHYFCWFSLSLVNYIEHYGLKRAKRANGKYEPCKPRHSWNANQRISNLITLNLQRHSDHHFAPAKPYQSLHDHQDAPYLPAGYPLCMMMAGCPALWFYIMDKKVMAWAEGDLSKTNLAPQARGRYEKRYSPA